ncbi:hypothetical protein BSKO_00102 [Bryopsis sp. KO-2023]|nr:hypothetical protein BSKO_00102 [Bryopsis sp. KO-2023]
MSGSEDMHKNVRSLLDQAHTKIRAGEATSALEDVINVLQMVGGVSAVLPALHRAREDYSSGKEIGVNEIEQLTKLMSDISLETEKRLARPFEGEPASGSGFEPEAIHDYQNVTADSCILAETGRGALTECALGDGSSFICSVCSAVVSVSRRAAHDEFWCQGSGV